MTRFFYDCEFLEDGRTIDLISIGIVADDGREYYAINRDAPWKRINRHTWLRENVLPSLPRIHGDRRLQVSVRRNPYALNFDDPRFKPHAVIATEVRDFLLADDDGERELWAYYAAYDHVALCQLWGAMIDLPDGIPMFTRDIQQERVRLGNPPLPNQTEGLHNALADARHNRLMFNALRAAGSAGPPEQEADGG